MKASELIKKLQEQIELHGDCDVCMNVHDYEWCFDVCQDISEIRFGNDSSDKKDKIIIEE